MSVPTTPPPPTDDSVTMPVGPTSTPKPENGAPPPTIVPPSDIDPPPSDTETSVFKKPWFWALVAAGTLATGGVVFAVARKKR
jgi:hypothetical protein